MITFTFPVRLSLFEHLFILNMCITKPTINFIINKSDLTPMLQKMHENGNNLLYRTFTSYDKHSKANLCPTIQEEIITKTRRKI